jgi:hypothetical protein
MQENIEISDFSNDDFASDKQIQKLRSEAKAYQMMIDESLAVVEKTFRMESASHKNLKGFGMVKSLGATVNYSMTSKLGNRCLHVSLVSYISSYPSGKSSNSGNDEYLIGFLDSGRNYPRTYIHKETIKEKLVDLLLKHDVDFVHSRRFSRNFQVLTEDKKGLQDLLELDDLNGLAEFPEMEVELYGQGLVFRNSRKPISLNEANAFVALVNMLLKSFK